MNKLSFIKEKTFRTLINELDNHDRRHTKLISVSPTVTIKETLALMSRYKIISVPIRARTGSFKHTWSGMISTLDLVHYLFTQHMDMDTPIEQVLPLTSGPMRESYRIYDRDLDDSVDDQVLKDLATGTHRVLLSSVRGDSSCMFTQSDLVHYLVLHFNQVIINSDLILEQCDLHTKIHDLISIDSHTCTKLAFLELVNKQVSAIPILDKELILGVVSDGLLKGFSSSSLQALDLPILEFIQINHNGVLPTAPTCTLKTTLFEVLNQLITMESHRVWVINQEKQCIGVISYTDIIAWLVKT